jgi:UMF1 family MFS transporter
MTEPRAAEAAPRRHRVLEQLGLHRPELRAWAMYDWANSAMIAVIMTAVFPIYFVKVAGGHLPETDATQLYARTNTIALALIAIISPILGTIADYKPIKKRMLGTFMGIGVAACACMFFIQRGDVLLAAVLFGFSLLGATGSFVFYEALLPHIARQEEMDRVSTAGYALGYVGGGILLALNLAWIQKPEWFGLPSGPGLTEAEQTLPVRLAFLSVAVWWLLFSIPIFRRVPEPSPKLEPNERRGESAVRVAFVRLAETFRELRGYRNAFLMLVAFMIYNDGIQTIIKMATAYGTELGIDRGALIASIMIVQFVGVPFAFLFGMLAGRIGAKRSIFIGLLAYTGISILGYFMKTATHFFALAMLVGMVQGGTQALSRSLFATMIPRYKSGEFFGFYSVFEKFAGILGPLVFDVTIGLLGSSRVAILSVIVFFAVGAALLALVNVEDGERVARAAEQAAERAAYAAPLPAASAARG